jgi:molybdenum cofactor cytidylyltransferase
VELAGLTFLARVIRACTEASLGEVHVVARADDLRIEAACASLGVALVTNHDAERGMSSSVHVGLENVRRSHGRCPVIVFPVDHPLVRARTLALIARAVLEHPSTWVRPCFDGRGGHPVGLGADLVPRILSVDCHEPLRETLKGAAAEAQDLECEDRGVLADVDDAADLVMARSQS